MNNRNRANIILISVFVLFIASAILKHLLRRSFAAGCLEFTAEAALIGGIADWFAVTALFRKPLGFSWHTAIIPRNRELLIEKVSEIVSTELLSEDAIRDRLVELDLTDVLLGGLSGSLVISPLEDRISGFFGSKAGGLDKERISTEIDRFIKENLKKETVSAEIENMLKKAFSEGRHREWLKALLDKALDVARRASTREKLYKLLKQQEKYNEDRNQAGSFLLKTLLSMSRNSKHSNMISISELLQKELISVMEKVSRPDSPIFQKLAESSERLLERLIADGTLLGAIQTWKNGILDRVDLMDTLDRLVTSAVESQNYRNEAAGWIAAQLDAYREDLGKDAGLRQWIDGILKGMLQKVIASEHHIIGEIARDTLSSFTNERLVRFIEEKAGNDLQWIRINGSIVGSAVGLLIYLFSNLLYAPVIVPFIRNLTGF